MNSIKAIISVLLCFVSVQAIGLSAPMKWHFDAYLAKFIPKTERHFIDSKIDASVDLLKADFAENAELSVYGRAVIWTGMGQQSEDIIFDPRDMHYSLIPGFRGYLGDYSLAFQWLHDCFHEVDRKTESTVIWNIFELRFAPKKFISEFKRADVSETANNISYLKIVPAFEWEVFFGILPQLKSPAWFQYKHPFSTRFGGNFRLGIIQYKSIIAEFEYEPVFWTKYGGGTCQKQYFQIALSYYSEHGAVSAFWGYNAIETQPVRPTERQAILGFRWRF